MVAERPRATFFLSVLVFLYLRNDKPSYHTVSHRPKGLFLHAESQTWVATSPKGGRIEACVCGVAMMGGGGVGVVIREGENCGWLLVHIHSPWLVHHTVL